MDASSSKMARSRLRANSTNKILENHFFLVAAIAPYRQHSCLAEAAASATTTIAAAAAAAASATPPPPPPPPQQQVFVRHVISASSRSERFLSNRETTHA
jgi:hypothetical protein